MPNGDTKGKNGGYRQQTRKQSGVPVRVFECDNMRIYRLPAPEIRVCRQVPQGLKSKEMAPADDANVPGL